MIDGGITEHIIYGIREYVIFGISKFMIYVGIRKFVF